MKTEYDAACCTSAGAAPCRRWVPGQYLLALLLVGISVLGFQVRAELVLSHNASSEYRIVVGAGAIPSEKYAAEELQRYVQEITGAKLPIVTDDTPATSREIVVGNNSRLAKVDPKLKCEALATDAFMLEAKGKRLIVAGQPPRGTLYGVYALLEEKFGVRWFTPEQEFVPKTNRLVLPSSLKETQQPALENREVFWTEMMRDGDFAARHRLNGNSYHLTEKHGGRFAVYFPFVHSLDNLVPQELYKDHPEYFPLIKGKRVSGYVQRCLANPDVLKLSIAKVRGWIREHPEASIISVSQNDTENWCQCEQCKALDDAEGSPAASMIRFVNAVAADIASDYPKIRIDTLAYQYTRKPPKTLRPRDNVIVRLCSIECCFAHGLESCTAEENRKFREDIVAWQPVAHVLYVWDYTPNFGHYQQPFPNFDALQPNVRFFVNHGVKGLFEQGNYSPGGNGELGPLRAYVLAKLLWNPNTDVKRHITEFLNAYYGKAAPGMQAYLELLHAQVSDGKTHAHIFDSSKVAYLNPGFLEKADEVLGSAQASAGDEPTRFRVQVARLPVWYVKLGALSEQDPGRAELAKRFLAVSRKAGISNISESTRLDDWAKKFEPK